MEKMPPLDSNLPEKVKTPEVKLPDFHGMEEWSKSLESAGEFSSEKVTKGLMEGLERNLSNVEANCKNENGEIDQTKLRGWLTRGIGLRTLRTGSELNYHWLSDGVEYLKIEIEKLKADSPLREKAKELINKAEPIIQSFAGDPEIISGAMRGNPWGETSRFVFVQRKD